jgi:hypothetical protein
VIFRSALDGLASVLCLAWCRICATTLLTASRLPICAEGFASFEPIAKPWFASRLVEVRSVEAEQFRADVVVPVPLHPDRQRERGYNQAEVIARPLARNCI